MRGERQPKVLSHSPSMCCNRNAASTRASVIPIRVSHSHTIPTVISDIGITAAGLDAEAFDENNAELVRSVSI